MVEAEGRTLEFLPESAIDNDVLETFPYDGVRQVIHYRTEEFSAVCPFSGLPDIAVVDVYYVPHKKCVELKSLKYYFVSYRNVGIYQEQATNRIFLDLWKVLNPKWLKIKTKYNIRGGIQSECTIDSDDVFGQKA